MENAGLPKHVAIIMDGNGRWAKKRFRPRWMGHRAGGETVKEVVRAAAKNGIHVLTLFAFGADNWRRPPKEVDFLMNLFQQYLSRETAQLQEHNIRLRIIGDCSRFSDALQEKITEVERLTQDNKGMTLVIAANYSGQWDICQAVKRLASLVKEGALMPEDVTLERLSSHLSIPELPHPDLLIRTSGEQRISNFYLWQLSYAELYFTEVFWPDFRENDFEQALQWYASRERRYGYVSEQLMGSDHV